MRNIVLCLMLVFCAGLFSSCATAPYSGRSQMLLLSLNDEKTLGLEAWNETLKGAKISTNSALVGMNNDVGRNISSIAGQDKFDWEFKLIDDDGTVNAFCLPGGKVAVYTGILSIMKNEAELACVVGHEVGHAIARHGNERMSQNFIVQAGGALIGLSSKSKYFAAAYGLASQYGVLLPYSREHEYEADYIGMMLMAKAGYDPAYAVSFWERFAADSGAGTIAGDFFSTHPLGEKRIAEMKKNLPEAKAEYEKTLTKRGAGKSIAYKVRN